MSSRRLDRLPGRRRPAKPRPRPFGDNSTQSGGAALAALAHAHAQARQAVLASLGYALRSNARVRVSDPRRGKMPAACRELFMTLPKLFSVLVLASSLLSPAGAQTIARGHLADADDARSYADTLKQLRATAALRRLEGRHPPRRRARAPAPRRTHPRVRARRGRKEGAPDLARARRRVGRDHAAAPPVDGEDPLDLRRRDHLRHDARGRRAAVARDPHLRRGGAALPRSRLPGAAHGPQPRQAGGVRHGDRDALARRERDGGPRPHAGRRRIVGGARRPRSRSRITC